MSAVSWLATSRPCFANTSALEKSPRRSPRTIDMLDDLEFGRKSDFLQPLRDACARSVAIVEELTAQANGEPLGQSPAKIAGETGPVAVLPRSDNIGFVAVKIVDAETRPACCFPGLPSTPTPVWDRWLLFFCSAPYIAVYIERKGRRGSERQLEPHRFGGVVVVKIVPAIEDVKLGRELAAEWVGQTDVPSG